MCAALGNHDPLNGCAADRAGLSGAAKDVKLLLKATWRAAGAAVIL